MSDAELVYVSSPWFLPLILSFGISVGFVIIARNRGRELLKMSELRTFLVVFVVLDFFAVSLGLLVSRAPPTDRPQLVIHRDYLACGSWKSDGGYQRVPWHLFSDISRSRGRPLFLEVSLRFDLDRRYLQQASWTDGVRSNGWVRCKISWLTDDPWRFGFTDTSEIHAQVEAAWRAALNRH